MHERLYRVRSLREAVRGRRDNHRRQPCHNRLHEMHKLRQMRREMSATLHSLDGCQQIVIRPQVLRRVFG